MFVVICNSVPALGGAKLCGVSSCGFDKLDCALSQKTLN